MHVSIIINEIELKELVIKALREKLNRTFDEKHVKIVVKTTKNYKTAEWEEGQFRATYEGEIK